MRGKTHPSAPPAPRVRAFRGPVPPVYRLLTTVYNSSRTAAAGIAVPLLLVEEPCLSMKLSEEAQYAFTDDFLPAWSVDAIWGGTRGPEHQIGAFSEVEEWHNPCGKTFLGAKRLRWIKQ